jgi:hypothetical protein
MLEPLIATSPETTIMPPTTAKIWLRRNGLMTPQTLTATDERGTALAQ